jgi:tetratricopeptide (TPR) repeat protein
MLRHASRYNWLAVKRAALSFVKAVLGITVVVVTTLFPSKPLRAQESVAPARAAVGPSNVGHTLVVIPFENASPTPGLEWLGESFPEAFHEQLTSPILYVTSRDERLRAYDRQGVPASVHPSRATLYRLAEQMDVDYAVLGSYQYNGTRLTASAQLLDMRAQKLLVPATESGSLADLGAIQSGLAWDLLRQLRADFSTPKNAYIAAAVPIRLDAQENYVRGLLAATADEKARDYREATHINPSFAQAWLELGKTYYAQHSYEPAIAALSQVPRNAEVAREANFYLGLAAYAHGDFAKSESAFEFVAARLPLAEVYNNLGVVAARRGQKRATDYFEKAIQDDPSDPDYHFNLGVALNQTGDRAGAVRELRTSLDRRPNDPEAKIALESVTQPSSAGGVVPTSAVSKLPIERIKRNYEEDTFRQMTTQMASWAEQRFARSDPHTHARFHVELGKELMAHGFTTEAEVEFRHAAAVDPSSAAPSLALAEDYDAQGDTTQARTQVAAALHIRESAEAYLILARIDLKENRTDEAAQNIGRALQIEPNNSAGQDLKRTLAAKLAEKAQPLSHP